MQPSVLSPAVALSAHHGGQARWCDIRRFRAPVHWTTVQLRGMEVSALVAVFSDMWQWSAQAAGELHQ